MEGDYEELYKWIEEHPISRPKRNINRDFADAVPLAEILKYHWPKLVEIHNYTSRNSLSQKLINWETITNKVLKKIKINMPKKRMEQLAKAEPGAIEKLLLEIKQRAETKNNSTENCEIYYLDNSNPSSVKEQPVKKFISRAAVAKMQADLAEKTEAITILKNKVDHLENLLSIKEERIKDLTIQLQKIVNQSTRPDSGQQGSKFFGFFQSNNALTEPVKNEA